MAAVFLLSGACVKSSLRSNADTVVGLKVPGDAERRLSENVSIAVLRDSYQVPDNLAAKLWTYVRVFDGLLHHLADIRGQWLHS